MPLFHIDVSFDGKIKTITKINEFYCAQSTCYNHMTSRTVNVALSFHSKLNNVIQKLLELENYDEYHYLFKGVYSYGNTAVLIYDITICNNHP